MLVAVEASQGPHMERPNVKLNCLALHSTIPPLDSVVLSPRFEDKSAPEMANLLFCLVHQLPICLGPLREELVKALDLLGFGVV